MDEELLVGVAAQTKERGISSYIAVEVGKGMRGRGIQTVALRLHEQRVQLLLRHVQKVRAAKGWLRLRREAKKLAVVTFFLSFSRHSYSRNFTPRGSRGEGIRGKEDKAVAVDYNERPKSETYRASKVNLNTTPYFFFMKAKAEDALSDIGSMHRKP